MSAHHREPREQQYIIELLARIDALRDFLNREALPSHTTTLNEWHLYLSSMKRIVGNASNDMSFIAALMAKDYLCSRLDMRPFDVGVKPQGAPGLDIDECTVDGRRVIAEIKTTTPYAGKDLGAAQKATFQKDFDKLNKASADLKFLFVVDHQTFSVVRDKYRSRIPDVLLVLLPSGETHEPLVGTKSLDRSPE